MKKLLYTFLLLSFTASAQTATDNIKPTIQNTNTSKHINIPGTRLYMIPPPGFTVAKTFLGLQKGESAMLNIYDLVGGNFYTNAATFSKAGFEQQGASVLHYQEIKVNGYPAKYVSMQGDPTAHAYALVFGDTTFSTMIMAVRPANDEATGKEIMAALNSIYYDKNKKVNPFETALFSLNDQHSRLKFFQYSASLYMYTVDGKDNTKDTDNPFLLVMQLPMDNSLTTQGIAQQMIGKVQQYGLTNPQVRNTSTNKINGYDTYEMEVYGQMKDKDCVIYLCVTAKGDKAISMQGIAKDNLEASVQEFKKLAHTIQIK
ncbi:MAG TPA: hypothetical protein VD794_05980 [Flavisolibacter sp.]|nr:hypothetical protein [Flavisolibacter sp.]